MNLSVIDILANIKEKEDSEGISFSQEEKLQIIMDYIKKDVYTQDKRNHRQR